MTDRTNTNERRPWPPARWRGQVLSVILRAALPVGVMAAGWIAYFILSVEPEKPKVPPAEAQPVRTRVIELRVQDYPVRIRTQGVVRPHNEITLSAQVSGRITRISPEFEDGSFFAEGAVLVELDAADCETAVALAEARLLSARSARELAALNHERNLEFLSENLIPEAEVDQSSATLSQAEADVDSATAQLDQAKRDLERTKIRAPFDGRVRQRIVGLGQLVGPSTPLGVVFAVDYAEVRLPIAGRELPFLNLPERTEGTPVEVELRNAIQQDPQSVWKGEIVRTEGALDENTLELFVVARVNDPFGRHSGNSPLRIGQPVTGTIRGTVLRNVVALPRGAVRQLDQIHLVDQAELTLVARKIVPLWSDEEHIIVRDAGLSDGTLLATTHLVYAPDGAKVEIIPDLEAPAGVATVQSNGAAPADAQGKPVAKAALGKKS